MMFENVDPGDVAVVQFMGDRLKGKIIKCNGSKALVAWHDIRGETQSEAFSLSDGLPFLLAEGTNPKLVDVLEPGAEPELSPTLKELDALGLESAEARPYNDEPVPKNRGRGRPALPKSEKRKRVYLYLTPAELAQVDEDRGEVGRSTWIRKALVADPEKCRCAGCAHESWSSLPDGS